MEISFKKITLNVLILLKIANGSYQTTIKKDMSILTMLATYQAALNSNVLNNFYYHQLTSINMVISKTYTNIMGTISFIGKLNKGMRKEQDFTVYPIDKNSTSKVITIQSDTRIGRIDLETGKGLMSKPHPNGAFFFHFNIDKLTPFELSEGDRSALQVKIFLSSDPNAGKNKNGVVLSDNSGAFNVL